jgi:hypothetical protein
MLSTDSLLDVDNNSYYKAIDRLDPFEVARAGINGIMEQPASGHLLLAPKCLNEADHNCSIGGLSESSSCLKKRCNLPPTLYSSPDTGWTRR